MIRLAQDRAKTLLAIHGWSAVFLGLLLYAVILTGVASVFAEELGDWSAPLAQRSADPYPAGFGKALQDVAQTVDPEYLDDLGAYSTAGGRLHAFFHRHETDADGELIERGVAVDIDPNSLQVIQRVEGTGEEVEAADSANALAHFFIELHVRLHIPDPWGLVVTGCLGLAMLVAAISGLVVHRHLLKELFTIRRRGKDKLLGVRDVHAVAGSWNLPFAFILAFTGSYLSFGAAFGFPAMAQVAFGGDEAKMYAAMTGNPPAEDATPKPMGNLDAAIADARARSAAEVTYLQVEHWGRADALVTLYTEPRDGDVTSNTYVYGGDAEFRYEKPNLGMVPSMGDSLLSLMAPLHFGNFAGLLSKAAWFALGFAGAYVTLTGMSLWTQRRREERGWRHLARAVVWVGHGLPLALLASSFAYFAMRTLGTGMHAVMMTSFLGVAAASALPAWGMQSLTRARALLLALNGFALAGLPLMRLATGGMSWSQSMSSGSLTVIAGDLALAAGGMLCLLNALPARRQAAQVSLA